MQFEVHSTRCTAHAGLLWLFLLSLMHLSQESCLHWSAQKGARPAIPPLKPRLHQFRNMNYPINEANFTSGSKLFHRVRDSCVYAILVRSNSTSHSWHSSRHPTFNEPADDITIRRSNLRKLQQEGCRRNDAALITLRACRFQFKDTTRLGINPSHIY